MELTLTRLQKSIASDKHFRAENITRLLKGELYAILDNYFVLDNDSLDLQIKMNSDGYIQLSLVATAKRSKVLGVLPEENSYI